jgi:hypothetical protein
MDPFTGAIVLVIIGFMVSVPAFALLTVLYGLFLRHKRHGWSIPAAVLAAPVFAAATVYLLALALQLVFDIVKDFP